jgi:hypothetical protein
MSLRVYRIDPICHNLYHCACNRYIHSNGYMTNVLDELCKFSSLPSQLMWLDVTYQVVDTSTREKYDITLKNRSDGK